MKRFLTVCCLLFAVCCACGASPNAPLSVPQVLSTTPTEALITRAIASRTVIAFTYHGTTRTVQPHRLGLAKNTQNILLRAYELTKNGAPSETWKLYDLQKISNLTLTTAHFPKNAPGYTPTDKALSSTLAEVPYTEEENKKETK